jgi:hypothetical protein
MYGKRRWDRTSSWPIWYRRVRRDKGCGLGSIILRDFIGWVMVSVLEMLCGGDRSGISYFGRTVVSTVSTYLLIAITTTALINIHWHVMRYCVRQLSSLMNGLFVIGRPGRESLGVIVGESRVFRKQMLFHEPK